MDAFAKAVLTCVPEPPPDARPQAIARAKERYDRLVKSAGQEMSGDARAAMQDLVESWHELTRSSEFRLRPPKPRVTRNEGAAWSNGFKLLMHYARSSRKTRQPRAQAEKGKRTRPYHQRCAIRVTYLKNRIRGQWRAHGRYLARESATFDNDAKAVGFNRESSGVDIAGQLENWQGAGDERLWKMIVSPEFGDRVDLSRLTRDLIRQMEKDLGTELEWVAVEHHNTEHPHVHMVVRGVRSDGESLRLSRDYVQQGIRSIAADLARASSGIVRNLMRSNPNAAKSRKSGSPRSTADFLRDASDIRSDLGPHYFAVSRIRYRLVWATRRDLVRHDVAASPSFADGTRRIHRAEHLERFQSSSMKLSAEFVR